MKNAFATWSKRLDADFRVRYERRLKLLQRVLSKASEATPTALQSAGLGDVFRPNAKRETALAVMRDVDLFVAVTSVGNDPTWHDGDDTSITARTITSQIRPK